MFKRLPALSFVTAAGCTTVSSTSTSNAATEAVSVAPATSEESDDWSRFVNDAIRVKWQCDTTHGDKALIESANAAVKKMSEMASELEGADKSRVRARALELKNATGAARIACQRVADERVEHD